MANQQVEIKSAPAGNNMIVDQGLIELKAGEIILFKNYLSQPFTKLQVQFFPEGLKSNSSLAISDFCTVMNTADKSFDIPTASGNPNSPKPGQATCIVNKMTAKVYEYTIAGTNYNKLDPVIIVEGGGSYLLPGFITAAAAAVIGIVVIRLQKLAYENGYRRGKEDS